MAISKYIKAPTTPNLTQYADAELRKIETAINGLVPAVETIRAALDWQAVTYQNGWKDYDADPNWQGITYTKDIFGFVYLQGMMSSGTIGNFAAFTLPTGYRPIAKAVQFPCISGGALGQLGIYTDGTARPHVGVNSDFSVSGITFFAGV